MLSSFSMFRMLLPAVLLVLLPGISRSHTFPQHSEPAPGALLKAAPDSIRIEFDADLEPAFSSIAVRDASGKKIDTDASRIDPSNAKLLVLGVPRLPPGTYTVAWAVASRDGHRASGEYSFRISQHDGKS